MEDPEVEVLEELFLTKHLYILLQIFIMTISNGIMWELDIKEASVEISIRKPTQKVEIVDIELIPDEFIMVDVTEKPDLIAIKKQLKIGDVAGVRLVDGTPSLTIK